MHLALAEKELEDCTGPEMKVEWEQLRSKDCTQSLTADAVGSLLPQIGCGKHKKDNRERGLFKKEFSVRKSCVFVVKFTAGTKKSIEFQQQRRQKSNTRPEW